MLLLGSLIPLTHAYAANVTKILYVYDNQTLTRTPQSSFTTTPVTLVGGNVAGSSASWNMSPAVAAGKTLTLPAQTVAVTLVMAATNNQTTFSRSVTVALATDTGTTLGSTTTTVAGGNTSYPLSFAITAASLTATHYLVLTVTNNAPQGARNVTVSQDVSGTGTSSLSFSTSTFINVDSVTVYNAVYPATTSQSSYVPNSTVYIRAVVSDPFGSSDVDPSGGGTAPKLTLTDPNSTLQLNAVSMTQVADSGVATKTFEYYVSGTTGYKLANSAASGTWTASITAYEGTEGTVTAAGSGSFVVGAPSLLIMKTVLVNSDPVEGTSNAKALPGAVVQYTVLVQNNGLGPVDSNTLVIADAVPANTVLDLTGTPPFTFTDGSTSSGLSVTSGSDASIAYSNNGGTTYAYVPSCTRPCTDPAITNFKITLTGSMNGKTGAAAPSFTININVVIQ